MTKWIELITPENVQLALVLLGAVATGILTLIGKKVAAEVVWGRVKKEIKKGTLATAITDKATVTLKTVDKVQKEFSEESQLGDTTKKKASRALRKIFRGLILRY